MCDLHMQYAMAVDSLVGSDDPTTVIVSFVSFIHVQDGWGGSDWHRLVLVNIWGLFLLRERVELLVPNHSSWGYHYQAKEFMIEVEGGYHNHAKSQNDWVRSAKLRLPLPLSDLHSQVEITSFKLPITTNFFPLEKECKLWYKAICSTIDTLSTFFQSCSIGL